jgi:hypothetical protein
VLLPLYGYLEFLQLPSWAYEYFNWIIGILSVIGFVAWVVGFRPRASCVSHGNYIDCESDEIVEETEFLINWGHVFFIRKMTLEQIDRNAHFRMLCKPSGGIKTELPADYYGDYSAGSKGRTLYLTNKSFYRKERINEVSLETTRPAPSDYRNRVEISRSNDKIEIMNHNNIELRGYPLELSIAPGKLLAYSAYFTNWKTSEDQGARKERITAFLSPINPCVGGKPGKKVIPMK